MEVLVGRPPGSQYVVVDPAEGHQAKDQWRGRGVSPGTPIHQQAPLCIRIECATRSKRAGRSSSSLSPETPAPQSTTAIGTFSSLSDWSAANPPSVEASARTS